ncbi:acetyl-CoA carboxylase biotin carboxyl carrier protein [Deinococcus planocerae]|uniref:acetyl-CoA carboxylase biotin carboxyl carrier protein n=1 Tax=Deinococcus planocerae TaxID=1737569 RepID=UPI000C7F0176|nr:acetyl-CoA carboxylase biotin carboxyl carrier protein [Deinococcus planocerae]
MNPDDLKKILDALSAADVREFSLQTGSYTLDLKRGPVAMGGGTSATSGGLGGGAPSAPVPASQPAPAATSAPAIPPASAQTPAPVAAPTPEPAAPAPSTPARSAGTPVKAPIVGTFYAASSPDAPAFVKVGDTVQAGQVLCIIEAMKLMNEIEAELGGTVREILVKNAEPVEYGQTLFVIE